jgi:hypothetical protein
MITTIVFERGLEYSNRPNAIQFDQPVTTVEEVIAQAKSKFNVRPVLLKEQISTGTPMVPQTESWRLFTLQGDPRVDLMWSDLAMGHAFAPEIMRHQHNLAYVVGAVVYHCKRLADVYSTITLEMVRISSILGHGDSAFVSFGSQLEPYYELDALLTATRRAYDASRYILWNIFGPKKGNVPSNFRKTLPECRKLPPELRETLEQSWQSHGEQLTEYRDCIIHYAPIDFGLGTASMEKLAGGAWSVRMRIPDNPEVKSQAKFTFAKGLDALTYGWELTNEIVCIATAVMNAVSDARTDAAPLPPGVEVK